MNVGQPSHMRVKNGAQRAREISDFGDDSDEKINREKDNCLL